MHEPPAGLDLRLPAPPDETSGARLPMATALAPLVLGIAMAAILRQPAYLLFALASPVMAAWSWAEERSRGRKGFNDRRARFETAVATATEQLEAARAAEGVARRMGAPDAAELRARARDIRPNLWERRPGDADFLHVRVGAGEQASWSSAVIESGGALDLRTTADAAFATFARVPAVPVVVPLRDAGVVGIAGSADAVASLTRWLVVQVAVLHSPRDVEIALAVGPDEADAWRWARWLPHVHGEASPLALGSRLVADESSTAELIGRLEHLVQERTTAGAGRGEHHPAVVLVVSDRAAISRAAITPLLERGPAASVFVVWAGSLVNGLPGECGAVVAVEGSPVTVDVTGAAGAVTAPGAIPDELPAAVALDVARSLTAVRDVSARDRGAVPEQVSLLAALGLPDATAESVAERWHASSSVDAPLGVAATGVFGLDLRADGPHALVGGTTGAGKSELLQTLVASLAASHPPNRVTFLLVDYKGGAAFKDCVDLPHTVGFVTDLDGHLVHRALISLDAELRRREHLLATVGAKDLEEMERLTPDAAPPSLVLIVDEFAALAKELPEFVDGVVNVAQRGRSLGIHLVLATQRPAGAVNDNIRANTNLRIALRMNDDADSTDVIATNVAAHLPRSLPGRAYVRTGASELTEVQVAYAGTTESAGADREVVVRDLWTGSRLGPAPSRARPAAAEGPTDLQRLVIAAAAAAEQMGITPPAKPWVPPLPTAITLDDIAPPDRSSLGVVGLVDEPESQRQTTATFDLERDGALLVYGTGGSGKTTLVRSLAVSLALRHAPDELHLYALDFASHGLLALDRLPHCGGVVTTGDNERVHRLFALLDRQIAVRRTAFARVGATNLDEHNAAAEDALPRILVLLDGYAGFAAAFERIDFGELLERLPRLIADGRSLGIGFVLTADRRGSVPFALSGVIPASVVLRQADVDDYVVLGLDARATRGAALLPGRGFLVGTREVQVAVVSSDARGEAQISEIESLGATLSASHAEPGPVPLQMLPGEVATAGLPATTHAATPVIGVAGDDLSPVALDLDQGHVLVASPPRSGATTTLATIANAAAVAGDADLVLLTPRRSPLSALGLWTSSANGIGGCDDLAASIETDLDGRDEHSRPLLVFVDDAHLLVDAAADSTLEGVARRGRDLRVHLIVAAEASSAGRSFGGVLAEIRRDRYGILLMPDPDVDGDLLGVRLPRTSMAPMVPGRGYLIERGTIRLVQIAH